MTTLPATRRFNVHEYYQMAAAGILTEDDRVELIEGEIVEMAPIGSRHAACVKRLNQLFSDQAGDLALVLVQDPIRLDDHSEPEPDLALLKPRPDFYASAHPGPSDVLLVVEVSDASVGYDRSVKVPLYARAGIQVLWLVDLEREQVEVMQEPTADGYRNVQAYHRGERLRLKSIPRLDIPVDSIFG